MHVLKLAVVVTNLLMVWLRLATIAPMDLFPAEMSW